MEIVADLHLHSKYSRAVSQQMVIPEMARWAKKKGIDLLGTGDFTHPLWFRELQANLEEEKGIFSEKNKKDQGDQADKEEIRFLLTAEISSIYSQGGRVRKIHNLIVAPSFVVAEKVNQELSRRGANLLSDGRPIIGLSAKDLLALVLTIDENCLVIPCHIWTPHFSLFGSESGFDSLQECFGDLSKYIYAVETGLSSDPQMNWQVEDLDGKQIVSFSDAHSPANLGREATILQIENDNSKLKLTYKDVVSAIRGVREIGEIGYTIEFYPEEGKYHYTGHRNCGVVQSPEETEKKGTTCPVCGRQLTVGVMERVGRLGKLGRVGETGEIDQFGVRWIREKRNKGEKKGRPAFIRLVPLAEILAETFNLGVSSQRIVEEYKQLVQNFGNELLTLTKANLEDISKVGGEKLAEGIRKVRRGDIFIDPGFDGEYGKVRVWSEGDEGSGGDKAEQMGLF